MDKLSQRDIEYIEARQRPVLHEQANFYEKWLDQSSARHASPELIAADALQKLHPGHSLVISDDHRLTSLFTLPGITIHASGFEGGGPKQIANVVFTPSPKHATGKVAGSLADNIIFGSYKLTWNTSNFILYITKFQVDNFRRVAYFILHDGPKQPARDLVLATSLYAEQIHDEIWVFNQGAWIKNKPLWLQIKDASWDDIVMKEESKKALHKDIYGFFQSEKTYEKLSIPWKRGLIMYGPPGNGKTISIKVIMKTCAEHGFTPLYVKSFRGFQGDEVGMQDVFSKARQLAPCVLIMEDLDSLINDSNRSFFLNQLDGLEGNNGLLAIASTNHFDRLDPGLSNRPSRFDRKYLFDNPDYQERVLYARHWQKKLEDNGEISFPESLAEEVAQLTQGFSFAYLKETFVSTLVRITDADDDERAAFSVALKSQIRTLREELGKQTTAYVTQHPLIQGTQPSRKDSTQKQISLPTTQQAVSDPPSNSAGSSGKPFPQGRVLHAPPSAYPQVVPGTLPPSNQDRPLWRTVERSL